MRKLPLKIGVQNEGILTQKVSTKTLTTITRGNRRGTEAPQVVCIDKNIGVWVKQKYNLNCVLNFRFSLDHILPRRWESLNGRSI